MSRQPSGEWILFTESRRLVDREEVEHLGSNRVTVVDRGRDDGTVSRLENERHVRHRRRSLPCTRPEHYEGVGTASKRDVVDGPTGYLQRMLW